jgi:L,D-transpeptidase YnhG
MSFALRIAQCRPTFVLKLITASLACTLVLAMLLGQHALAATKKQKAAANATATQPNYEAEARLIEIYKLIGASKSKEALLLAQKLTADFPNYQLGHLVYGDLLLLQSKPIQTLGEVPVALTKQPANTTALAELREESAQRIKALRERPPLGAIPSQLLALAPRNKHVIAVDASKSRMYLLENTSQGLKLVADYYASVGQAGIGKVLEGDNKTPLGVYYLTSTVDPKGLPPLYGGGAIPINYPNPYDQRLGKTGNGIWFHGTMPDRYARQPKSTNGCVVLANPDLRKLMSMVAIRTTPVIIASQLTWVMPHQLTPERQQFETTLNQWREAKNNAQTDRLYGFYLSDFYNYGKTLKDWWPSVLQDLKVANKRVFQWNSSAILMWRPEPGSKNPNIMVVTYDEQLPHSKQAVTKRQYWMQVGNQWKIFFEGSIASQ